MPRTQDVDDARLAGQGPGLFAAIRSHLAITLGAVVAGVGIAILVTLVLPTRYSATSQVVIGDPNSVSLFKTFPNQQPAAAAQNAAEVMRSAAVLSKTSQLLGHRLTAAQVANDVSVSPSTTSSLVTINASSHNAVLARNLANTEAKAFIDVTASQQAQLASHTLQALKTATAPMQAHLALVNKQAAARAAQVQKQTPSAGGTPQEHAKLVQQALQIDPDYQALRNQAANLSTSIAALKEKIQETRIDSSLVSSGVDIVLPAGTPGNPTSPDLKRNVAIGAVLGLLLGAALAWRREDGQRAIGADQVAAALGAPQLGEVKRTRELRGPAHVIDMSRGHRLADDLRVLASSIVLHMQRHDLTTCVLTSALPGEGKTVFAMNLAAAAESIGYDVALVPADAGAVTAANSPNGRAATPGPAGATGGAPAAISLVDSPAVTEDPTALRLGAQGAALVVVVSASTSLEELRTLRARADLAGARIVGFLRNERRAARRSRNVAPSAASGQQGQAPEPVAAGSPGS